MEKFNKEISPNRGTYHAQDPKYSDDNQKTNIFNDKLPHASTQSSISPEIADSNENNHSIMNNLNDNKVPKPPQNYGKFEYRSENPNHSSQTDFQKYLDYSKWMKFLAIMLFIGAAPIVIAGFTLIIFFGLGLLYWAVAAVLIYSGILLLNSAKEMENLSNLKEPQYALKALDEAGKYFKVQGIMQLVSLILVLLGLIAMFGMLGMSFSQMQKEFNIENLDNSINSSLESSLDYQLEKDIIQPEV